MLSNARENTPATPGELPSPGISASPNRSHRFAAANRATRGRESCYLRPRAALPSAANRQLVKLFRKREIGKSLFWNMSLFHGQRAQTPCYLAKKTRGFFLDFERPTEEAKYPSNNSLHRRRSPTPYSKFTAVIELFVLGASSSGLPNVPASSSIFVAS